MTTIDISRRAERHYRIGIAYIESGEYPTGLDALEKAVELSGEYAKACFRLGEVYHRRAQYYDGVAAQEHAKHDEVDEIEYRRLRLYPTSREYLDAKYNREVARGHCTAYSSYRDEMHCLASLCFDAATNRVPGCADAYFHRGRSKLNDEYIDSSDRYNRIYSDSDDWYPRRYGPGPTLNTASAIEDFSEAIRIEPEHLQARKYRAIAFLKLNHYEVALADLDIVVRLNPRDAEAYRLRSEAHRALGNCAVANADFDMSKWLSPDLLLFPLGEREDLFGLAARRQSAPTE